MIIREVTDLISYQSYLSQHKNAPVSVVEWTDYKWQLLNSIRTIASFEQFTGINFSNKEKKALEKVIKKFPLSITPYYASLINIENYRNDPIFKQAFPSPEELTISKCDMKDPLHEDKDSPVKGITHRYPDRVLFIISNKCAMYCRHCTRKRKVGDPDQIPSKLQIQEGIKYIKNNPAIRDVLLSGGDALMLPDGFLDWVLTELNKIQHVEVIRIGTRVPVVLPYRITDKLVDMLKRHHPLWLNTHFNHPRELTPSAKEALRRLADAGIPLGNQTVLLAGVNDCPQLIKELNQKLVQNRVRPYYLFQCDLSEGLSHFRTPVGKGIEIMESLIGHTSGFAVPRYVIDAPNGGGKIPVMPNYIVSWSADKVVLRNYEGVIITYQEPRNYKSIECKKDCSKCTLQLKENVQDKIGVEKLLADNDTVSLVPENNQRLKRRQKNTYFDEVVFKIENEEFTLRNISMKDIKEVYKLLIANRPYVGLNSQYTYFLLARDFKDSCVVIEKNKKIVGFSSGYVPLDRPETFFNWEIVVHKDYRGKGLQKCMLLYQLKIKNVTYLEATVNPSNRYCKNNIIELAKALNTKCVSNVLLDKKDFDDGNHEEEILFRVGPISQNRVQMLIESCNLRKLQNSLP